MKQLAEDVYHAERACRRTRSTCTSSGDVLIDAATRQGEKRIMRQIAGQHA